MKKEEEEEKKKKGEEEKGGGRRWGRVKEGGEEECLIPWKIKRKILLNVSDVIGYYK